MQRWLAVVLALLVFVPHAAPAGSWASPAPIASIDAVAPAQLVSPENDDTSLVAHVELLLVVALVLGLLWLGDVPRVSVLREPAHPPGRRGRAVLHAYLN